MANWKGFFFKFVPAILAENIDDPIMMQTMNAEKAIPNGGSCSPLLMPLADVSTGVHKKTKMYMQASTMLWMHPKSSTRLSDIM